MDNNWSVSDIQKNMATRLAQDIQMDQTVEILSLIQGMIKDKSGRVAKEEVIIELLQQGMSEAEILSLLQTLIDQGTLQEEEQYILL